MANERVDAYAVRLAEILGGVVPHLGRMPYTVKLIREALADLSEEAYGAGFEAGEANAREELADEYAHGYRDGYNSP